MRVFVAFLSRSQSPGVREVSFASSACAYATERGVRADLVQIYVPYGVTIARNKAVRLMRETPATADGGGPYTHLMFVDDDVLIPKDAIYRLASADKDIICGQVPSYRTRDWLEIPYVQCMFAGQRWQHRWLEPDGLHEIEACGFGCVMIRRNVLETLGFPWFTWPDHEDKEARMSEDVEFCLRARAAGFRVFADSMIRCSHLKTLDVASQIVEHWDVPHDVTWTGPQPSWELDRISAYGTHVPALVAIGKAMPDEVRHVVEFGGGMWSTPVFLNREVFPHMAELTVYESDPSWAERIRKRCRGDARLFVEPIDVQQMPSIPQNGADLVFIDCGDPDPSTYSTRKQIMREQMAIASGAVVVVHDTEDYQPGDYPSGVHWMDYTWPEGPRTSILSWDKSAIGRIAGELQHVRGLEVKRLARLS